MNEDEYVMIQSDKLLKYAKTVFGDIVVNAWIADDLILGEVKTIKAICEDFKKIKLHSDGDLEYSFTTIVFEFSNGKRVTFSSSEWSFISAAGENYKEVKGESI